jgi:hypothetical protein
MDRCGKEIILSRIGSPPFKIDAYPHPKEARILCALWIYSSEFLIGVWDF